MQDKTVHMDEALSKFIESWGLMGSIWGINPSVARVHALLIASDEPVSLDVIANSLKISRGNASMSLRDLRNWGIVKLVKEPGDRQDYYVTVPDIWKIFIAITKERKRREFDPTLEVVRETLSNLHKGSPRAVKKRLEDMEKLLATFDMIGNKFLVDENKAKYVLSFLSKFSGVKKKK